MILSKGALEGGVDQVVTLKQIDEKAREKKRKVYVGFINLEKTYARINRKAVWQVLRRNDVWVNF